MRVYKDGTLENSTYVTNLLVDDFSMSMENIGGKKSRINRKNERQNRLFHTMVRTGLLDSNQNG